MIVDDFFKRQFSELLNVTSEKVLHNFLKFYCYNQGRIMAVDNLSKFDFQRSSR